MKIISIIIATYNAEKYISRCIESIIFQKTNDIELLIIDGDSKDNTVEKINRYKDEISYFISEPDKGIYDAWNKGIKMSTGQWIMFLGADDILLPQSINRYIHYLKKENLGRVDIISGKCEYYDDKGHLLNIWGNPYKWDEFRKYMKISHGSTLHNRALFNEIGLFNLNYVVCADYELLLRKKLNARFYNCPIIRMQTGGMSFSTSGQIESFKIRKLHQTIPLVINLFYLVIGIIGLYRKKICWNV